MNKTSACCSGGTCATVSVPTAAAGGQGLFAQRKFLLLLGALAVIVPFEMLSLLSVHLAPWIEIPLFLTLLVVFGHTVFRSGLRSLLRLNFSDINLLMTIAVVGAAFLREFEEAVIIVVLFALGEALEQFGVQRSKQALEELVAKTPKTALLKGRDTRVPIEEVEAGAMMVVKPGDLIPLDGDVVEGASLVDEAAITGEPLPKSKNVGDGVFAGTQNGQGYIEVKVTKTAKDTTLAKIIDLTYQSAEKKSESQKFVELFSRYYTPAVILTALLLASVPVAVFGQPFRPWFTQALTVLLISCPCALVISTPIAVFSAIGNATRRGILIKGGKFIEEMGKIRAIALDKTRTLTRGEPVVSDIVPFNGFSEEDVLACAGGLEVFSEHPIAKSILQRAKERNLTLHSHSGFEAVMGKGVKGECTVCTDAHHCMGSLKFVTEEHAAGEDVMRKANEFERQGKTTIVISDRRRVKGVIGVTDEIRPESKAFVGQLRDLGIEPVILTGDNKMSAWFVAEQVGIRDVQANLLPDGKVRELRTLLRKHTHVAMVGDGVNDAPALTTASVGIAMGAIGSDLAIENADIALMTSNLTAIPFLVRLGKKASRTIRINIAVAVGVKVLFLVLALVGQSNLALAIFADVGVTVLVVLNSLRLFSFA